MNQQSEEFETQKRLVGEKKNELWNLQDLLKQRKKELSEDIIKLQDMCVHKFVRECITSGCYPEYANICLYCKKMN